MTASLRPYEEALLAIACDRPREFHGHTGCRKGACSARSTPTGSPAIARR
jgi:hypothetical protein